MSNWTELEFRKEKLQNIILNMNFILRESGKISRENYFYNVLLSAWHCSKLFAYIVSFANYTTL